MIKTVPKNLKPEAQRALAEAKIRRERATKEKLPTEHHGRKGPEATRFGDWEKNGIASDF